jgi:hypothetical protein
MDFVPLICSIQIGADVTVATVASRAPHAAAAPLLPQQQPQCDCCALYKLEPCPDHFGVEEDTVPHMPSSPAPAANSVMAAPAVLGACSAATPILADGAVARHTESTPWVASVCGHRERGGQHDSTELGSMDMVSCTTCFPSISEMQSN